MTTEFIADAGTMLSSGGKSLLLSSFSVGKRGQHLSDHQVLRMAKAVSQYNDGVSSLEPLPYARVSITEADADVPVGEDVAYKFTDDQAVPFWASGSIKLDPPATYQNTEKLGARDVREGYGFVYMAGRDRFATVSLRSGFNSLVLCTSADARKSERPHRSAKFGNGLIKIHGASEFAAKLGELAGAERCVVRDVTYSDTKVVKSSNEHVSEWVELYGVGELEDEFLEHLANHHLDELIKTSDAACILTKPVAYRLERERRFLFTMPHDITGPLVVKHKDLRTHIELLV